MTRSFRAIRLRQACLTVLVAGALTLTAGEAFAGDDTTTIVQQTATTAEGIAGDVVSSVTSSASPDASNGAATQAETPADASDQPTIETSLHHFYCVEYARLRSGLEIFGDAKTWWQRAGNLYAKFSQPANEAVMVFSGSARLARGHVAVVTRIVSPREIRVDQANWGNRGEIDHNTPVLDVSARNDWSKVRVWDVGSSQFGSRIYAISGFIGRGISRSAGT